MKIIFSCLLATVAILIVKAQNDIDLNALPPVADLMVQVSNPAADTIILCSNGGPNSDLETTYFSFYHGISTFSTVYVRQYQQYNTSIMDSSEITLNEAIIYDDTTVAILRKVVNHFNGLGKIVVVTGHSFGAFVIAEYLDDYSNADLHKVIPMAGRLNMNDTIWNAFSTGHLGGFQADGVTPFIENALSPSSMWAGMKLMAGFGYNKHIDSLVGLDLMNLMYLYGTNDEAVGSLVNEEVSFLTDANATVVSVPSGGHGSMFTAMYMNQALNFIRSPQGNVGILENGGELTSVKMYPTVTDDYININTTEQGFLQIFSLIGQSVKYQNNFQPGSHQIDLSEFGSGMYFVSYFTDTHEKYSQKIIVR